MTGLAPAPIMSQQDTYQEQYRPAHSQQSKFHYPPVPVLQQPSAAYHSGPRNARRNSGAYVSGGVTAQSSASTDTSVSSAGSIYKPSTTTQPYQFSSHAERGLMQKKPHASHSPWDLRSSAGAHGYEHTQQEMIEDNAAVFRYIREQQQEPQEEDHAVWILVCYKQTYSSVSGSTNKLCYSSGSRHWIHYIHFSAPSSHFLHLLSFFYLSPLGYCARIINQEQCLSALWRRYFDITCRCSVLHLSKRPTTLTSAPFVLPSFTSHRQS